MNRVIECEIKLTRVLAVLNADPKRPSAFSTPPGEASRVPLASSGPALAGYAVSHFDLMTELKEKFKQRQV